MCVCVCVCVCVITIDYKIWEENNFFPELTLNGATVRCFAHLWSGSFGPDQRGKKTTNVD